MVSVIVPIYNIDIYLQRCVDSILAQTYCDFELILVDDGSTDQSGKICDDYKKDKRIKVIHKQNGGISSARNSGMEIANGDYYLFIDGDDYVHKFYIETLVACQREKSYDLVIGGLISTPKGNKIQLSDFSYNLDDMPKFVKNNFDKTSMHMISSKLYSSCIIRKYNIQFDTKICFAEDRVFNMEYLKYCRSVRTISATQYYYTDGSMITTDKYGLEYNDLLYLLNELENELSFLEEKHKITLSRYSLKYIVGCYKLENIYSNKTDNEYYELYKCYTREGNRENFYLDEYCSPIKRTLFRIARCYKERKYEEGKSMMKNIHFLYHDYSAQSIQMHSFYSLLFKLICHERYGLASLILNLYSIYKNATVR